MTAVTASLNQIPHVALTASVVLAVLGAEIVALLLAHRRWKRQKIWQRAAVASDWGALGAVLPSRTLEILAAAAPLAIVAVTVLSVQEARATFLHAVTEADQGQKARDLSRALSEEITAIPLGVLMTGLATALAIAASGLAASARLRIGGLLRAAALAPVNERQAAAWARYPGSDPTVVIGSAAAFVALGLGPLARGIFNATRIEVKGFTALAAVAVEDKVAYLDRFLTEAAAALDRAFAESCVSTVIAMAVAIALSWWHSLERRRRELSAAEVERPASSHVWLAVMAPIAVAAVLLLEAAPMKRENDTPWPALTDDYQLGGVRTKTPLLVAPDRVERAPVVALSTARLALNGYPVDEGALQAGLEQLHELYSTLHPGERFDGSIVVVCEPDVATRRLDAMLAAVARAGYREAQLTFLKTEVTDRPMFGARTRHRTTAARTALIGAENEAPAGATVMRLEESPTYEALAERIVSARRNGEHVALLVGL
jgi:hypothetical protein